MSGGVVVIAFTEEYIRIAESVTDVIAIGACRWHGPRPGFWEVA